VGPGSNEGDAQVKPAGTNSISAERVCQLIKNHFSGDKQLEIDEIKPVANNNPSYKPASCCLVERVWVPRPN
jgi:hypothetical protein